MAMQREEPANIFLGFDPGGENPKGRHGSFGWSICSEVNGTCPPLEVVKTGLARNALDAVRQVVQVSNDRLPNSTVLAAGIDAPLFSNQTGFRWVDHVLKYRVQNGGYDQASVVQMNSLYGAATMQGKLTVTHLTNQWNNLQISECHPTLLWHLLQVGGNDMAHLLAGHLHDHKRDATLAALSAWAMAHNPDDWVDLYLYEAIRVRLVAVAVGYWMPNPNEILTDGFGQPYEWQRDDRITQRIFDHRFPALEPGNP